MLSVIARPLIRASWTRERSWWTGIGGGYQPRRPVRGIAGATRSGLIVFQCGRR